MLKKITFSKLKILGLFSRPSLFNWSEFWMWKWWKFVAKVKISYNSNFKPRNITQVYKVVNEKWNKTLFTKLLNWTCVVLFFSEKSNILYILVFLRYFLFYFSFCYLIINFQSQITCFSIVQTNFLCSFYRIVCTNTFFASFPSIVLYVQTHSLLLFLLSLYQTFFVFVLSIVLSNVLCFCSFYRSIKRSMFLFFLSFYQTFYVSICFLFVLLVSTALM